MIAFMIIIYVAVVAVVFRVFKVKPHPYSVAITVTGGVVMIGGLIVLWLPSAPFSKRAVVTRYVVQLVPWVKGQVQSISAKPNVPLKKGDALYQIDPTPYQLAVNQAAAQHQAAKSNVAQFEASVQVAEAAIKKVQANVDQAKASLDVAVSINEKNPAAIAKIKLDDATNSYAAALAGIEQAEATRNQARAALLAAQDAVVSAQSQLETAQFNLRECTVVAPADGFVTNWQIREGTYVTSVPMAAAGTFVDTSETAIIATFPANQLMHVKPDQEVELIFKSRPGQLFRGFVEVVIQATGEGQFMPNGKLPSAAIVSSPGVLAVKIRLHDAALASELEMGTPGAVAIYTDQGKPFSIISKIAIRMQKWMYFLPLQS